MGALVLVLSIVGVVVSVVTYFSAVLAGGTRADLSGTPGEHARTIADLGPVRQTFTTYSPWRFRFGLVMLVVGIASAAGAYATEVPGAIGGTAGTLKLISAGSLLFGITTMLYVAFSRVDRLDLHARGLALYQGRSDPVAAYYPDIRELGHSSVLVTSDGHDGGEVVKGLLVNLYLGGGIEIGINFVGFNSIAEAVLSRAAACAKESDLVGPYLVTGSHLNAGTPEEVTLEARSPQHARIEALNRYGVIASSCKRVEEA